MRASDAAPGLRGQVARPGRMDVVYRATLELAAEGGYQAVTISRVARRAGVSRANLYQHHFSKDDLICGAFAHIGPVPIPLTDILSLPTLLDRVIAVLDRYLEVTLDNLLVAQAVAIAALHADERSLAKLPDTMGELLAQAVGDALPPERSREVAVVLEHVYVSLMLRLSPSRPSATAASLTLHAAARLLLSDASPPAGSGTGLP